MMLQIVVSTLSTIDFVQLHQQLKIEHSYISQLVLFKKNLPVGESNSGLMRDRHVY